MEDWVKFVNAIIERIGFISALISTITSIIYYKLILEDVLWAILVGCVTYIILLSLTQLGKFIKKCCANFIEYRNKCLQCYWFYETLSDDMKASLSLLYKMPYSGYKYCRIICENDVQNRQIIYDCKFIQRHTEDYNFIIVSQGLGQGKYTIVFDECLYDVIRKNN